MPCDTMRLTPGQKSEERLAQIKKALMGLEAMMASGNVTLKIGPQGAVAFVGADLSLLRDNKISDVCAFRKMQIAGSPALRMALARAEALAGRKINLQAMAAGQHSHDQGGTWSHH